MSWMGRYWTLLGVSVVWCFSFSVLVCAGQLSGGLAGEARHYWEEGRRAQQAGDIDGALVCYQKAVLLDPAYATAYDQVFAAPSQPPTFEPPAALPPSAAAPALSAAPLPALPRPIMWPDASRLTHELSKAYFDLGVAYTELKAYAKAIQAFEKSLALNPRYAQAHAHLGLLYKHVRNDADRATRHLQTYLQLNPQARDREELESLLALMQRSQLKTSAAPPDTWVP